MATDSDKTNPSEEDKSLAEGHKATANDFFKSEFLRAKGSLNICYLRLFIEIHEIQIDMILNGAVIISI